MIITKKDIC